jgi:transcriptional regulator with XRE-family HTH domain
MNGFAERLRKLRKHLGLTQLEFSEKIGLSRSHLSGLESGKEKPSDSLIRLICLEFSVNEQWLRHGEGEPFIDLVDWISERLSGKPEAISLLATKMFDSFQWGLILEKFKVESGSVVEVSVENNKRTPVFRVPFLEDQRLGELVSDLQRLWIRSDKKSREWMEHQIKHVFPVAVNPQSTKKSPSSE